MKFKKSLMSIAIALIFALFVGYGIEVFDPSPEMEDYCPSRIYEIYDETECLESGGVWYAYADNVGREVRPVPKSASAEGYCEQKATCYTNFEKLSSQHDKMVFIVSIIVGLLTIIVGIILKREVISAGILSGAVLLILYGTIRYWRYANDILKFVLLGIALAVLIWIAYKKVEGK